MNDKSILSHLKDNWIIYAFVVQLVASFVLNNADHIQFDERIDKLENNQVSEEIVLDEIKTRLTSIETNLEWIKLKLK